MGFCPSFFNIVNQIFGITNYQIQNLIIGTDFESWKKNPDLQEKNSQFNLIKN